jgi:hypothetical protein
MLETFYEYNVGVDQLHTNHKQAYDSNNVGQLEEIIKEIGIRSKSVRPVNMTLEKSN